MTAKEHLTTAEAADYLRKAPRTLIRWRALRIGPAWHKVGHHVLYKRTDLDEWVTTRRCDPVREPTGGPA